MRACLALCVAVTLVGAARAECGACIDGRCYRQQTLPQTEGLPMDINRNTNVLYYLDDGRIKQCRLNTKKCYARDNFMIVDLQGFTIDQNTGDIYVIHIMQYGIYKLDLVNSTLNLLLHKGMYDIVFKDKLYYSQGIPEGIFTFEHGESQKVKGTEGYNIRQFIIDKNNEIFFEDYTNPRNVRLRSLSNGVVRDRSWDNSFSMTVNSEGDAVFVQRNSRAVYRVVNGQLIDIGAFNDTVYGTPFFDGNNNIIYRNSLSNFSFLKKEENVHCSVSEDTRIITETASGDSQ